MGLVALLSWVVILFVLLCALVRVSIQRDDEAMQARDLRKVIALERGKLKFLELQLLVTRDQTGELVAAVREQWARITEQSALITNLVEALADAQDDRAEDVVVFFRIGGDLVIDHLAQVFERARKSRDVATQDAPGGGVAGA